MKNRVSECVINKLICLSEQLKKLRGIRAAEKLEQNVSGWYSDTFGLEAGRAKGGRVFPCFWLAPSAPLFSHSLNLMLPFKAQDTYYTYQALACTYM